MIWINEKNIKRQKFKQKRKQNETHLMKSKKKPEEKKEKRTQ
jgi:hypothetical protein